MKNVYQQLAVHLDAMPVAFPRTESGLELKILQIYFTPAEAEIALHLTGVPESPSSLARRINRDDAEMSSILEGMARNGLLFRTQRGEERKYNLIPFIEGLWEFKVNLVNNEEAMVIEEYLNECRIQLWGGPQTGQHRVIPLEADLSQNIEIMQYDSAESIIKAQNKIVVTKCPCRRHQLMIGNGCDNPLEVCMAFGTGAYFFLENGWGREIDQTEALQILEVGRKRGLVLQPGNGQKSWSLCLCCSCCCHLLKALKLMPKPAHAAHSNYYAACIEDQCTLCESCFNICPMDAISLKDAPVINLNRCIGCGACTTSCMDNAMIMKQKDHADCYVPPRDMVEMLVRIAQERKSTPFQK